MSAGPHKLIREGAVLTTKLEDILENLGPLPQGVHESSEVRAQSSENAQDDSSLNSELRTLNSVSLTDRQKLILEHLDIDGVQVDHLIERSGLDAPAVLQELTLLSLKGVVKRVDGQSYARKR
jgi:predicted Rossmann fold nucleotide-binding protein DprA/Smf involved in DNA uptake